MNCSVQGFRGSATGHCVSSAVGDGFKAAGCRNGDNGEDGVDKDGEF